MKNFSVYALLAALLVPTSVPAQQNMETRQEGPFFLQDGWLAHDHLSSWSALVVPSQREFWGVVSATGALDDVERASLRVMCRDTFAGYTVSIQVAYVLVGGTFPRDEYTLNLFNSAMSGRTAAYDIGSGLVRTDDIQFPFNTGEAPPVEFIERSEQFWYDLQGIGEERLVEIRFREPRSAGPYVQLFFPLTGFSEIVEQSAGYCPR